MKEEIRAALGCAPEISRRPKHFQTSLSTNSSPRIGGPRGLTEGSCTPASMNGRGTALTTATASPGIYRHNNGNSSGLSGSRGNAAGHKYYFGEVRNGFPPYGKSPILLKAHIT